MKSFFSLVMNKVAFSLVKTHEGVFHFKKLQRHALTSTGYRWPICNYIESHRKKLNISIRPNQYTLLSKNTGRFPLLTWIHVTFSPVCKQSITRRATAALSTDKYSNIIICFMSLIRQTIPVKTQFPPCAKVRPFNSSPHT